MDVPIAVNWYFLPDARNLVVAGRAGADAAGAAVLEANGRAELVAAAGR
ncbi:hypothetical protein D043_2444A, partial [Vibrio parahaemolyticus EKP-021]